MPRTLLQRQPLSAERLLLGLFLALCLAPRSAFAETPSRRDVTNFVRLVSKPDIAFQEVLDIIRSAESQLDLEYFIFNPCHTSSAIVVHEIEKRIQTVKATGGNLKVRLLLDAHQWRAYFPHTSMPAFSAELAKRGIETRIYNPTRPPDVRSNHRNHRKLIVADGRRGMTGGRNIEDQYFGLLSTFNYIDRDAVVIGPAAKRMAETFEEFWAATSPPRDMRPARTGRIANPIQALADAQRAAEDVARVERCLQKPPLADELLQHLESRRQRNLDAFPYHSCPNTDFVSDRPRGAAEERQLGAVIHDLLDTTPSGGRITVENYLFIPDGALEYSIAAARDRNVDIHYVTNQAIEGAETKYEMVAHGTRIRYGRRRGIRFSTPPLTGDKGQAWVSDSIAPQTADEMTEPGNEVGSGTSGSSGLSSIATGSRSAFWGLHSKAFVFDGKTSVVGSYNLDPRSRTTNSEAALVIRECPAFALQLESEINSIARFHADPEARPDPKSVWEAISRIIDHATKRVISEFLLPLL